MKILDCESTETIYNSIYNILGLRQSELEQMFKEIDIESYYLERSKIYIEPENLLFSLIMNNNSKIPSYDRVCWFHLTRIKDESVFDEGILTLNEVIDSIWSLLYSLVKKDISYKDWQKFRQDMGSSEWTHQYNLKAKSATYGGPYAVLIKDFAFMPEQVGNYDYLKIPEIIEDICMCFLEKENIDLFKLYSDNTKPCIVKFWHDDARPDCITTILYYLYNVYNSNEITFNTGTNFDGHGKSVPKENIIYIEIVDYK
jgi:hypothetical protein